MNGIETKKGVSMWRYACWVGVFILVLCGFTFLLSSCDKDAPEGTGSGEKVVVNLSLGSASYGGEAAIRSFQDRNAAPETVIVPVAGDLYMYATLEADPAPATRAAVHLDENTTVHVVAYTAGTSTVAGSADYTIDGSGDPVSSAKLTVPAGSYDFVAYSYNNTTQNTWDDVTQSNIDPSNDLLWGKTTNQTVSVGNENVTVTMSHKFARVTVKVTTSAMTTKPRITAIGNATVGGGCQSTLTVADGTLTAGAGVTQTITNWSAVTNTAADSTCISDPRIVYPVSAAPVSVGLASMTLDGYGNYINLSANFNRTLDAGVSYTLRINIKRILFASSNIYWDGGKLTFDPHTATPLMANMQKQGVVFKWGSLVGISCPGVAGNQTTTWNAGSAVYVPTDNTGTAWTSTTVGAQGWTTWAGIPYLNDSYTSTSSTDSHLTTDITADYSTLQGDICQFINSAYRMPTRAEFGSASDYNVSGVGTSYLATTADGQTALSSGATYTPSNGMFFPASGSRYTDGTVSLVGTGGYYWSSSASSSASRAYYMGFGSGGASTYGYNRTYGFAVRCVLK